MATMYSLFEIDAERSCSRGLINNCIACQFMGHVINRMVQAFG